MIGTLPHCCSQYCFYQQPSFFSPPPPPCKSKSRLGFNDGHSWSLRQASLAAEGGPCSAPSPPHCPAYSGTPTPFPSCLVESCPQTPCSPPIPPDCSVQKCDSPPPPPPPHCSVLCLCRAGPIPPYVVLISTQRPSVKTANYVATRAQFTLNLPMHGLCTDPCALRLHVITGRSVKCARRRSNSLLGSVSGPQGHGLSSRDHEPLGRFNSGMRLFGHVCFPALGVYRHTICLATHRLYARPACSRQIAVDNLLRTSVKRVCRKNCFIAVRFFHERK